MRLLPLLFKAVLKGDNQTFDMFAAPSGTHEEIKARKDGVVQVYHVKNNAPPPVANQPNGAILASNEGGATQAPRAGEKPMQPTNTNPLAGLLTPQLPDPLPTDRATDLHWRPLGPKSGMEMSATLTPRNGGHLVTYAVGVQREYETGVPVGGTAARITLNVVVGAMPGKGWVVQMTGEQGIPAASLKGDGTLAEGLAAAEQALTDYARTQKRSLPSGTAVPVALTAPTGGLLLSLKAAPVAKVVSVTQTIGTDVPAAPVTTTLYQDARRTLTVDDGILTATPVKGPVGTLALDGARISGIDSKIAAAIKASGQDPTDWYSLKSGMKTMALPPATRAVVEQAIATRAAAIAAKKQAAEAAAASFDATLEGQRAKLVRAEYNSYSPEHFPGSRPWLRHQQDEKALQAFDAAHPEIAAKIQAPKNPAPVVPEEKTPAPKRLTPANIARLAEHVSQEAMRQVGYPYDNAVSEATWAADHLPQTANEFNKVCAALPYTSRVKAAAILLNTAVVGARLGTHDNKGQPIHPVHKKWKIDAPEAKPAHRCAKCGKPAVGMSNFGGWRCANHYDDAS